MANHSDEIDRVRDCLTKTQRELFELREAIQKSVGAVGFTSNTKDLCIAIDAVKAELARNIKT